MNLRMKVLETQFDLISTEVGGTNFACTIAYYLNDFTEKS